MTFLPILLFVLSASLDTFVVALAYGSKKIKIGFTSNFVIASIGSLGTLLSMLLGKFFMDIITLKTANLIGALVLFVLGIYFILDYRKNKYIENPEEFCNEKHSHKAILKFPEVADTNHSGNIELSESFALSVALALNNFALGIAASITGLDITVTTITTFVTSFILIKLGFYVSRKIKNKFIADKGGLISGIIILILAIIEAFN